QTSRGLADSLAARCRRSVTSAEWCTDPGERVAAEVGDGHRVILRVIRETDSKKDTTMTVRSSIDPARLLEEQLAQASPDLLRELLGTFINTLLSGETDAVCGAEYGTITPERTNR